MAQWREWNPTNKPGTCVWCGRVLRFRSEAFDREGHWIKDRSKRPRKQKGGDYHDGFFCGLRCGYLFGVQMATFGRRLNPRQ